jgi:hypothetical protein
MVLTPQRSSASCTPATQEVRVPRHNREVPWERFDPEIYWDENYSHLRKDDQFILTTVGTFFAEYFRRQFRREGPPTIGIDVGSGSNFYPALTLLPWCNRIVLSDCSPTNRAWLEQHRLEIGKTWQDFWVELVRKCGYQPPTFAEARTLLAERSVVRDLDALCLPKQTYDVGTMFFVAESMTNYESEFEDATGGFLSCLLPGAPFAAAFMDSSTGYSVGTESFPAVQVVTPSRVKQALAPFVDATTTSVQPVPIPPGDRLRDGYEGMIIAVGTTAAS